MNPEVFREYDVRGIVGTDLDESFVRLLGKAIGTAAVLQNIRTMTLGRDCRLSSESYRNALVEGLLSTGIHVVDIGMCATPMLYFSIRYLQAGGGVMITGSHNPPEFNGFKICIGPDTIYGPEIQSLRTIMERSAYIAGTGKLSELDISEAYANHLFNGVKIRPGIKVVLDGGNGVGGHFALPLLRRFGCQVTDIYCEPDGRFPNHFPDPTIPENLATLIAAVKQERADIGIAYDGDADRIGAVTNDGTILWGDELLLLFSRFILKETPGAAIIGEVKCSQKLYDDILTNGGRAIMWKAGHSLIKGKMKEEKALLAGEMSGHIFFADRYFGYDDAIYASLRLLEIISTTGMRLSDILANVPQTYTTPEIRIDCPDAIKFKVVEIAKAHFRETFRIIDIDGVRVIFDDGWGLIRSSNTQPVLVLRFEAASPERLDVIRRQIEAVLKDILANIK